MYALNEYTVANLRAFQERLRESVDRCTSIEQASQHLVDLLFHEFAGVVLVRVYAIHGLQVLPQPNREWLEALARAKGVAALLGPATPVMSLVGTRGVEAAWNDRKLSKGHVGIPLVSREFVETIPMVAALLSDFGASVTSRRSDGGMQIEGLLGGSRAGIFYVDDAATAVDARGRKIIPEQDFVATYEVKTVFGIGGAWASGERVACIVFTRQSVERSVVRRVAPILSVFLAATNTLAVDGRHYADARQESPRAPHVPWRTP
jgi:hypothetical protein